MSSSCKFTLLSASLFLLGLILCCSAGPAAAAAIELEPDEYEEITGRYWAHGFIASRAELDKIRKAQVVTSLSGNIIVEPNEIFIGTFHDDERAFLGQRYLAVRAGADVVVEGGKQKIGATVSPLALIEIVEISGVKFRAKIVKMRQPPMAGDNIVGFKPRKPSPVEQKVELKTLEATITGSRDDKLILGPGDVVYIDAGRANGLSSGRHLEIFSKPDVKEQLSLKSLAEKIWYGRQESATPFKRPDLTEPILIGRATVTSVRKTTSAAIITEFKREILLGDFVRIIAEE